MRLHIIISLIFFITMVNMSFGQGSNFEEAQKQAKKEEKKILMVFSGSDWCKPCIELKNEILESAEFISFQEDRFIRLVLDFPYNKKNQLSKRQVEHNEILAERYNEKGHFPLILLLDDVGDVLAQIDYHKGLSTDAFIDELSNHIYSESHGR